MSIMEIDAVIRVRIYKDIIILHVGQVQLVYQRKRVLHVHVVIGNAVYDKKAHVLLECRRVGDRGVIVA